MASSEVTAAAQQALYQLKLNDAFQAHAVNATGLRSDVRLPFVSFRFWPAFAGAIEHQERVS
eukprot:6093637-Pleurochrysis_carterae.AAC.1